MSSTRVYQSNIEIPKGWMEQIEKCQDRDSNTLLAIQRREFIKIYYGKKTKKDIANVLGMNERTVFRIIRKLRKQGEIT